MDSLGNVFIKIVFVLGCFFCGCASQKNIEIGEVWKGDTKGVQKKILLMPPYGFQKQIDFSVNNINFTGAVDANDTVIFLSTANPVFKINGVQYIGKPLSSFEDKSRLKIVKGWGSYLPIVDKWYAYFGWEDLTANSKVVFVFKIR